MLMGIMNCDDEKMAVISSTPTTNGWPQNNHNNNNVKHMISNAYHQKALMNPKSHNNFSMSSPTAGDPRILSGAAMEKPGQDQQQQLQQQAQKCPRCDSANTKFCYYNNYSLSQPRHFCKACKRYWTRGGTLRNVPVGGGCRKNKRLKRPSTNGTSSSSPNSSSSNLGAVINSHPSAPTSQIDLSPGTSNHHRMTSLFYNRDMILPFSRFSTSASGYDHVSLQPQLGSLGLGFLSSGNGVGVGANETNYLNGLMNYGSIFGTPMPASTEAASPAIASLLTSKFNNGGLKDHVPGTRGLQNFQSLAPFDDELHTSGVGGGREADMDSSMGNNKHMKLEDGQGIRALDWIHGGTASSCDDPYQMDQIGLSSDPSLYWTNPTSVGGTSWHDPANLGSNSVPSLI